MKNRSPSATMPDSHPSAQLKGDERMIDALARQFIEATATPAGTPLMHMHGLGWDKLKHYLQLAIEIGRKTQREDMADAVHHMTLTERQKEQAKAVLRAAMTHAVELQAQRNA